MIELRGILQPSELLNAHWVHLRPRPLFAVVGILLLLLSAALISWYFFGTHRMKQGWAPWLLLGALGYLAVSFFIYHPYAVRRTYKQRKDLQRELTMAASDEGLSGQTADGTFNKPWGDYLKWKEGKSLFLLYLSDNLYQIFPKRMFSSPQAVDEFRALTQARVKRA